MQKRQKNWLKYTKAKVLPNLRVMKVTKQMQTKVGHFTSADPEN